MYIVITRKVNTRIRRVVKAVMKLGKLIKRKLRNNFGVATTVNRVRVVGEDTSLGSSHQKRVWARVHTLHFVIHNTLVRQWIILVLKFQVPSLLRQHHGVLDSSWMKDGISIYIAQIVKVLFILTRHYITRSIRVGESIQKRLQASFQQMHKWVLGLVLATSAQHRMFQNMRNACRIFWWCSKGDTEHFVVVLTGYTQELGTRLFVSEQRTVSTIFIDDIALHNFISRMFDLQSLLQVNS